VTSLGRSTLVGWNSESTIINGAIELPPDTEFCDPHSVRIEPSAPARWMPYSGLWGLLPVSFSERAGITAPFVSAIVPAPTRDCMPRRNALSAWNARPNWVFV
jgi:hypothetical protein